jgi:hypothetical protein
MSAIVKKSIDFLKVLNQLKTAKERKAFLSLVDKNVIHAIAECFHNIRLGNIKVTEKQKKVLRRNKKHLQLLVEKTVPIVKKRKVLVQRGGAFLPIVLPAILSFLLSNVIKNGT